MTAESHSSLVSISIRVAKLGLSDEAIQAWDLQKEHYIILLIKYNSYYKTCDAIISEAPGTHGIEFRVGVSKSRKPTVTQAMAAFSGRGSAKTEDGISSVSDKARFTKLFISGSLNEFMNEQFTSLLKIRRRMGLSWDGAKRFFHDSQGRLASTIEAAELDVLSKQTDVLNDCDTEMTLPPEELPSLVTADHVREGQKEQLSLPLIAMQFLLRYLTRCTEFCLVCHDKTEDNFAALKPYVCSRPLCLYQVGIHPMTLMTSAKFASTCHSALDPASSMK